MIVAASFVPVIVSMGEDSSSQKEVSQNLQDGEALIKMYCYSEHDDPDSEEYTQCTKGIALLEQVVEVDSNNVKALVLLVRAYRNRSWERGIEFARKLIALDPDRGEGYLYIARRTKNVEEKTKYLRKAEKLLPNDPGIHGELALHLSEVDSNMDEALHQIKKQIQVNPRESELIFRFIDILRKRKLNSALDEILVAYLKSTEIPRRKCGKFLEDYSPELRDRERVKSVFSEQCKGYY